MATSFLNGNKIHHSPETGKWYYEDGQNTNELRACPKCNRLPDENGHDACLGNLPGVKNACCGHGVQDGYIQFLNRTNIKFEIKNIRFEIKNIQKL